MKLHFSSIFSFLQVIGGRVKPIDFQYLKARNGRSQIGNVDWQARGEWKQSIGNALTSCYQ